MKWSICFLYAMCFFIACTSVKTTQKRVPDVTKEDRDKTPKEKPRGLPEKDTFLIVKEKEDKLEEKLPTPAEIEDYKKEEYNIALLLPIQASKLDMDVELINPRKNRFLHYWLGVKYYLNYEASPKEKIHVNIIDTEASSTKVYDLIRLNELDKYDLIWGAALRENVRMLSEYTKKKNKIYISSFSSVDPESASYHRQLIKLSPALQTHINYLLYRSIEQHGLDNTVALVSADDDAGLEIMKDFTKSSGDTIKTVIVTNNNVQLKNLSGAKGIVVVSNDKEELIHNLYQKISNAPNANEYTVYGLTLWKNFHKIYPLFQKVNTRITSTFTKEKLPGDFERKFKEIYGHKPEELAYIGYLNAQGILEAITKYGTIFPEFLTVDKESFEPFEFVKIYTPSEEASFKTAYILNTFLTLRTFRHDMFK